MGIFLIMFCFRHQNKSNSELKNKLKFGLYYFSFGPVLAAQWCSG